MGEVQNLILIPTFPRLGSHWFTVHVLKYYLLKHPKDKKEYISQ